MFRRERPSHPPQRDASRVVSSAEPAVAPADFPWRVVVVAVIVLGAHGVGLRYGAYSRITRLDDMMHALGGFLSAWGLTAGYPWAVARGWIDQVDRWTRSVLVLGLVAIVALVWEFFEFTCDHLVRTGFQGSIHDTMSDLFLGLTGGTVYLVLSWLQNRTPRER